MPDQPEDGLGLPPGAFARIDDTDDDLFYEPPRLVLHIDDGAVAALTELYRSVLPAGGVMAGGVGGGLTTLARAGVVIASENPRLAVVRAAAMKLLRRVCLICDAWHRK